MSGAWPRSCARALPGIAVTASSDVLPVVREYERSLATVLNAAVMPGVATYVARLEAAPGRGEGRGAAAATCSRTAASPGGATIRRAPALTALSGPAAGVVGARDVAAACGIKDIITVDIGGTSADICLIKDGTIALTQHGHVGEWPLPLPMVDMVTIGAGGGSIAAGRRRHADRRPAERRRRSRARPPTAAAAREATVTDAHVVLGHLPAQLLGGRMALDAAARGARDRQHASRGRSASAARRRRAACWPSSTTT